MSLRRCPECHKKVSDQAARCVKCGYPFRKNKARCMQIIELEEMKTTLKEIQSDLKKMHQSDIDENSVSISVFKAGIIGSLAIAFGAAFIATLLNTWDVFHENLILYSVIITVCIIAAASMVGFGFLLHFERKNPQKKSTVKRLSIILCFSICAYISLASLSAIIADVLVEKKVVSQCMTYHMLFGVLGFVLALMIQEVWHTKDKTFIFAFIALVWALIVGIVT